MRNKQLHRHWRNWEINENDVHEHVTTSATHKTAETYQEEVMVMLNLRSPVVSR